MNREPDAETHHLPPTASSRARRTLGVVTIVLCSAISIASASYAISRATGQADGLMSAAPVDFPVDYTKPAPLAAVPPPEPNLVEGHLALSGIAMSRDEIGTLVGMPGRVRPQVTLTRVAGWHLDTDRCGGVVVPNLPEAYEDSGYSNLLFEAWRDYDPADPGGEIPATVYLYQQLTAFKSTAEATGFVASENALWRKCVGQPVVLAAGTGDETYRVNEPTFTDGLLEVESTREDGKPSPCRHTLTSRRNVVVDVAICGDPSRHVTAWALQLAERIPR